MLQIDDTNRLDGTVHINIKLADQILEKHCLQGYHYNFKSYPDANGLLPDLKLELMGHISILFKMENLPLQMHECRFACIKLILVSK